jgi:hypothetical protein
MDWDAGPQPNTQRQNYIVQGTHNLERIQLREGPWKERSSMICIMTIVVRLPEQRSFKCENKTRQRIGVTTKETSSS